MVCRRAAPHSPCGDIAYGLRDLGYVTGGRPDTGCNGGSNLISNGRHSGESGVAAGTSENKTGRFDRDSLHSPGKTEPSIGIYDSSRHYYGGGAYG
jgi:hypothetical protein